MKSGALQAIDRSATPTILAVLSELAASVQRRRTIDSVLETAGRGVQRLGMRFGAFQLCGDALVLRYLATSPVRQAAIEARIGRSPIGLSAPLGDWDLVQAVVNGRRIVFRHDLNLFDHFLRRSTGYDPQPLEALPETASVTAGVLAPLFVRDEPWGLLAVYSREFTRADEDAVALFATHVGSALEVAESLEVLAAAQQELVKRERMAALGELAAVVAHEVRNPLAVLFNAIGSLQSIVDAGSPTDRVEDAQKLLGIASEEASRLRRIVFNLLQFARPDALRLGLASVSELVEDVSHATRDDRLRIDVGATLPLVPMDSGTMRQALLNLVQNALDVVGAGGSVTIGARAVQRSGSPFLRIAVKDDGPGIPTDVRAAMFDPFFTTKASGTGLGLAIVKRVVDAHHGVVEVDCDAGGTTFALLIPIAAEAGRSASAKSA